MSDWTPGPWKWDVNMLEGQDGFTVIPDGFEVDDADRLLIALAPEMAESLEAILGWLESTDEIVTNHGAHSDAVWARKLLARARGEA